MWQEQHNPYLLKYSLKSGSRVEIMTVPVVLWQSNGWDLESKQSPIGILPPSTSFHSRTHSAHWVTRHKSILH